MTHVNPKLTPKGLKRFFRRGQPVFEGVAMVGRYTVHGTGSVSVLQRQQGTGMFRIVHFSLNRDGGVDYAMHPWRFNRDMAIDVYRNGDKDT